MQGRMAFSTFYANNIQFDEYLNQEELHTSGYPELATVKAEVENSPLLQDAVKNTVLFTLHPVVIAYEHGARRALQKGTYIVQA
jgi:hypothetical protein